VPRECVDASASRADHCAARDVWCDVASAVDGVLSGLTLAELSVRQRSKQEETLSYCI
jgi:DNA-binding IscR family transcriptional regulator